MVIENPTFIVIEFSGAIAEWVKGVRDKYEPGISHMPVEVTVAGSSGCGPINPGQSLESIVSIAKELLPSLKGKLAKFQKVSNFSGTPIHFLEPERSIFDEIHGKLIESGISFEESPFPYNPHISLKGFTPPTKQESEELLNLEVPKDPQPLHKLSVIEMKGMTPNVLWSTGN